MPKPVISVVMAAHNEQRFLAATLDSLFGQTYDNFEVICVDDGSTDRTPTILSQYAKRHPNLRVITNKEPMGLTASLNKALDEARGEYIARADADDLYDAHRLAEQKLILDVRSPVVVVGSQALQMDENGKPQPELDEELPCSDTGLRWRMLFNSPLWHPSVMWRAKTGLRYDETCRVAQDYELWTRMATHGKMVTLKARYYHRRNHTGNISGQRRQEQIATRDRLSLAQIKALLGDKAPPPAVIDRWRSCFINQFKPYGKVSLWDVNEYFRLLTSFCQARKWNKQSRAFWVSEVRKQMGYLYGNGQLYLIPALLWVTAQARFSSRKG
jgi:glycosyltransferase involved in cell wall biosynthesis